MFVFSELVHALSGDVVVAGSKVAWRISPGDNDIDDAVWAVLAEDERITARIDNRRLRVGHRGSARDYQTFVQPVDRRYITELSAPAAAAINDGQLYDGGNRDLNPLASVGRNMHAEMVKMQESIDRKMAELRRMELRSTGG